MTEATIEAACKMISELANGRDCDAMLTVHLPKQVVEDRGDDWVRFLEAAALEGLESQGVNYVFTYLPFRFLATTVAATCTVLRDCGFERDAWFECSGMPVTGYDSDGDPEHEYGPDIRLVGQLSAESIRTMSLAEQVEKAMTPSEATRRLRVACRNGNADEATRAIRSGGDVNQLVDADYGLTLLHHAASNGDVNIIDLLVENGASVNAQMVTGKTALHFAVQYGQAEALKALIRHGADVRRRDSAGETAMKYAEHRKKESPECYRLLQNVAHADEAEGEKRWWRFWR